MSDSRFVLLDAAVADCQRLAKELQAEITNLAPYERKALGHVVRYLSSTRHNTTHLKDMQ
ncbi:hypothetical protein [Mycolicibacterium mucogenicum]|uniref:Uncharacterized protein n=1 Tax=Mycolicibacterium mucogenicum DSM 44124 TaxID=1226753 RepID=A0A8H2J915_MYCMU|nr:hypothetical protein [Mycolicibacterium mucogenicum]KAB7761792.1 hypothetical protein MMUC44124_01180 [Mycolicibacterium mucogenicum DSM 44124]QPG70038.1 hypothetical protein C1S78_003150 [Mycolicibacterium mucogenicum DSM 44124]